MKRIAKISLNRADSENPESSSKNYLAGHLLYCCVLTLATVSPAMASIQIVGLTDRQIFPADGQRSDSFCIVSTAPGGAVSLAFTSGSGNTSDGQSWLARNAAGVSMNYLQTVRNVDSEVQVSRSSTNVFTVNAGRAATSAAACGSGNVTKSAVPTTTIPSSGGSYVGTVTVIASPI